SNVNSGDRYTYDLWFNNTVSGPAGRVWINDSLPSELTFLGSSDPGAKTGNYNWTWTAQGVGNYRLSIDVQVRSAIPPVPYFRNTAFLNYTDEKGFSWPTKVASADVAFGGPVISLTKSSTKTLVHSKETIVYQITIQNTGEPAQDLWVNLTLGPGLGYLNATLVPLLNGGEVHFALSNVPLGPTTIFVNASVDPGVADHWPMTINGSVAYTDAYRNVFPKIPVASNLIEASVPRIVLRVSPAMTSIEADALVFYNIYLVNAARGVSGAVQLSQPLPASFLYITDTSDATLTTVSSTYT